MFKKLLFSIAICLQLQFSFAQLNMSLLGQLPLSGKGDGSDIWGYVDELGNEYALVGMEFGVSIVDVTIPSAPNEVFWVAGNTTWWRDLKTWNNKAYITNEGGNGLMIIDLDPLPGSTALTVTNYTGSTYPFTTAHNLYIDENGYCYIFGANSGVGGAIILNLNLPTTDPNFEVGRYNQYYLHDGVVRGDTLWGAAINDGFLVVINVATKSAPVSMATKTTPSFFTHNAWFSDDNQTIFTTDEQPNAYLGAYDVSDLGNISELGRVQSSPGMNVIPHNVHFMNDYIITSYYRDGVTVHDVCDPTNMVEVGNYDTSPTYSGDGFNGCWGVYPWLPSGNIIASDIENGLFVLGINYIRAQKLEGVVTDSITSNPINGVQVNIVSTSATANTNVIGGYKIGIAATGTYDISFSKAGYVSKTITGVSLNAVTCDPTILNVELIPLVPFTFVVNVIDANTLAPVPNAKVRIENTSYTNMVTTNASGIYTFSNFTEDVYTITAGKWGYVTNCDENVVVNTANSNYTIAINTGYYDDFSFNFNWTISGTASAGIWERGEPIGTLLGSEESNPDFDVTTDCNFEAFVTGNAGGNVGDDDVDGGETILTSPVFDASTYSNPYVNYYRWFYNAGGTGSANDQMNIKLSNGTTTVTIETVTASTIGNSSWVDKSHQISSFLTPTNNMRVIVTVNDIPGGHISEGAFDKFEITEGLVGVDEVKFKDNVNIYPNPFNEEINIQLLNHLNTSAIQIQIVDVAGRLVDKFDFTNENNIQLQNSYKKGVYFINIYENGLLIKNQKVIKY
ncbi:MAG: choice-of-anchor B family protein [Bacteroidetes bacterium]|nr:choice-of-anchor B family protein [Bacteroidota bacterium]